MKSSLNNMRFKMKLISLILRNKFDNLLVEQCEHCQSYNIVMSEVQTVYDAEGQDHYYAKYLCKDCGATAHTTEVWYKDSFKKFCYQGNLRREYICAIIDNKNKAILLESKDQQVWQFPSNTIEKDKKTSDALFDDIYDHYNIYLNFIEGVKTIKDEESIVQIFACNDFRYELNNNTPFKVEWVSFDKLKELELSPLTQSIIKALKIRE